MLAAVHQSGTVPKIVAKIKAGGQQVQVDRQIHAPDRGRVREDAGLPREGRNPGRRRAGRRASRCGPRGGPQGGLGGGGGDRSAFAKCLPERLQRFRATITTPEQTLQQVVNPPQTNIKSSSYTIAGVDLKTPGIGVVTSALVSNGRFIDASEGGGAHEALLSASYASRQGLKVGSKLDLNGTDVHGRRARATAARRPDGRRLRRAGAAAGAREPEEHRQRPARPRRRRSLGRRGAEADRDALSAGAGRERAAGRRLDQRLARRRRQPLEAARHGACRARRGGRVPARSAPDALVGRQAGAGARHAEGARLDAVAGRAPGRRRVAHAGRPRRPARRRPRESSWRRRSGRSARR